MTLGLQMINWMIKPGFWYDPEGVPLDLDTEVETCPPETGPQLLRAELFTPSNHRVETHIPITVNACIQCDIPQVTQSLSAAHRSKALTHTPAELALENTAEHCILQDSA